MTLRKRRLGERERDFSPVRGAQALSLVTELSRESWLETGRDLPTYSRAETPYRFARESRE